MAKSSITILKVDIAFLKTGWIFSKASKSLGPQYLNKLIE
jgi:hypothetical protein